MIRIHMPAKTTIHIGVILIDAAYLLFLAGSLIWLSHGARLPDRIGEPGIPFAVRSVDGVPVSGNDEAEFAILDKSIGETVHVEFEQSGEIRERPVPLEPAKSAPELAALATISFLFFALGGVVYFMKRGESAPMVFHWASVAVAASIAGTRDIAAMAPPAIGAVACVMFFLAYGMLPALFLHFTLVFPARHPFLRLNIHRAVYGIALLLAAWESVSYVRAVKERSMDLYRGFGPAIGAFEYFFPACIVAGLVIVARSYGAAAGPAEKKQIRWIIFGLAVGSMPFAALWLLPQAIIHRPLIPEWVAILFLAVIPPSFAVSIVKYRLLDIDVVLNRSVVYGIVIGLLLTLYAGGIALFGWFLGAAAALSNPFATAATAVLVGLLFQPLRVRVQSFVDRRFFRVRYDFQESERRFVEAVKGLVTVTGLGEKVVAHLDALLAPERIGFFEMRDGNHRLRLVAHRNFPIPEGRGVSFDHEGLKSELARPVALDGTIEPGPECEAADEPTFRRWGIALVFPMLTERLEVIGLVVLGPKKSGARFTADDVDLLNVVAAQAGLALERIRLQVKVMLEHEENERLQELNRMKSFFVSSVSHDLRTPLSAIRMYAELLLRKPDGKRGRERLGIIIGESDRLARLVGNLLSFGKKEAVIPAEQFAEIDLNEAVRHALSIMSYELAMEKCDMRLHLSRDALMMRGDADTLPRVFQNLIENAVKYSPEEKHITVSTYAGGELVCASVADNGRGIPEDQLEKVFEPYYQVDERTGGQAEKRGLNRGLGIGLANVRDIVKAHGGTVCVDSAPGKGSTFTVSFPAAREQHHKKGSR